MNNFKINATSQNFSWINKNVYPCSVDLQFVDCDYYSCNDENYDTCIEEPMCSEINCYSWDQICDGIVNCQESGADEMGCDLSEGDRMAKMRKPQVQNQILSKVQNLDQN